MVHFGNCPRLLPLIVQILTTCIRPERSGPHALTPAWRL